MDDLPALLHDLPGLSFGFMLVIARVGTTALTGPALGETEIPSTVRIALAAGLAVLVFPVVQPHLPALPATTTALAGLFCVEIIVGAWLGLLARVLVLALSMAGGIMSYMVGLSSVLQMDPSMGAQVPALERMLGWAAITLLFVSGLYELPVRAIINSYQVIPPGSVFDTGAAAQTVTHAVSASFALALRLAAPFVVVCIVWQAALGLVSRLVPNILVHIVAQPAQILAGLMLLAAVTGLMFETWSATMRQDFLALPNL
ncbi:MAG TPA: flagellar biosynthetic protein FliR [Rhodopila sp.]|nr:flagellar biosynthetic protein FliR [Rhodopila sp.]